MQLNSQSLSTNSRDEFCLALKTARERKGITLDEIAEVTKIPASLFAALERNDLRQWPEGLFKRSFFRDYVRMIGVPVAEACAEFVRLFPDEKVAALPAAAGAATEAKSRPLDALRRGQAAMAEAWRRGAEVISRVFGRADDGTSEPVEEPELRTWVTDARRVGPAPSPRFRVRIKLPR